MTQRVRVVSNRFMGVADSVSDVEPTYQYFLESSGGNHEQEGVWKVRRGMEHTGFTKKASSILAITGFENANGTTAYAIVAGTSMFDGELESNATGYGDGGYGSQGYGD